MSDSDNKGPNEHPGMGVPPGGIAPSGRSTLRIVKDGLFNSAKKTLEFLDQSEKDKTVKVRVDDSRAIMFFLLGLAFEGCFFLLSLFSSSMVEKFPLISPIILGIGVLGDCLLGIAVLWYVTVRFQVLQSLDPRYAILAFQLLLGTGIMFAFFAVNTVVFFLNVLKWGPH